MEHNCGTMEHNCGILHNWENFGALLKSIIGNVESIIGPGLVSILLSIISHGKH